MTSKTKMIGLIAELKGKEKEILGGLVLKGEINQVYAERRLKIFDHIAQIIEEYRTTAKKEDSKPLQNSLFQ